MKHLLVTNDFPPKIGGIQSLLWEWWRRLPPESFAVLTSPVRGRRRVRRRRSRSASSAPASPCCCRIRGWCAASTRWRARSAPSWSCSTPRCRSVSSGRRSSCRTTSCCTAPRSRCPAGCRGRKQALGARAARRSPRRRRRRLPGGRGRARRRSRAADHRRAARRRHRAVPPARRRPSARRPGRDFGLPVDAELVVSISRLVPRKGFDTAIRAAAQLRRTRPDLRARDLRRRPRRAPPATPRGRARRAGAVPRPGVATTTCRGCTAAPTCTRCCAATAGAGSSRRASASCSSRPRRAACRRWPATAAARPRRSPTARRASSCDRPTTSHEVARAFARPARRSGAARGDGRGGSRARRRRVLVRRARRAAGACAGRAGMMVCDDRRADADRRARGERWRVGPRRRVGTAVFVVGDRRSRCRCATSARRRSLVGVVSMVLFAVGAVTALWAYVGRARAVAHRRDRRRQPVPPHRADGADRRIEAQR